MKHILSETRDGIARIEINRPDKKNALTAAMYQAMADAINAAEADAKVRVTLIHGKADHKIGLYKAMIGAIDA